MLWEAAAARIQLESGGRLLEKRNTELESQETEATREDLAFRRQRLMPWEAAAARIQLESGGRLLEKRNTELERS